MVEDKINQGNIFLYVEERNDISSFYKKGNAAISKFMGHEEIKHYHTSMDLLYDVIEKVEDLDFNSRVSHQYTIIITGNGTTIEPSVWAGERWMIRYNSRNNRKINTWRALVNFIENQAKYRKQF